MQSVEQRLHALIVKTTQQDKLSPRARETLAAIADKTWDEMDAASAEKLKAELAGLGWSDLGISSMEQLNLLKLVEAEFGVEIPVEEAGTFTRGQDMVDYIERRT